MATRNVRGMGIRGGRGSRRGTGRAGHAWSSRGDGRGRRGSGVQYQSNSQVDILDDLNDKQWNVQRKRQRQNTGGNSVSTGNLVSKQDSQEMKVFCELPMDEKLNKIMLKLLSLDDLSDRVTSLESTVNTTVNDISEIKTDIREFDLKLKSLEYMAIDQEARGRRNNL